IAVNEQASINLGRTMVNTLWETALAPFLAQVAALDLQACGQKGPFPDERERACAQGNGTRIRALPGFRQIDRRVQGDLRGSSVSRVKLFDLSGTTVYATPAEEVGQESRRSPGWQAAVLGGRALSELTYRDTFSSLHGEAARR